MKVTFDGQLFLKGNKTGIAWCADNLIKELSEMPELDCRLNVFVRGYSEEELQLLGEYRRNGLVLRECKWFNDIWYKLIWPFLPMPYQWFFGDDSQITQFFNYVIPPGVRGKKVTIIHDMSHLACPQYVRAKTKRWLDLTLRRSCRRADAIVTISEFSKGEIMRYMGISADKITVMPLAVDKKWYHTGYSLEQIESIRRKYGISGEYFLYLGTIEPRKNIQRILDAYIGLKNHIKDVPQLVLAGGRGWRCDSIYDNIKRLNMPESIILTGYVPQEDAPVLMAGAMAFLFPSLYEGFGMPVIEAMACGTPVITSNATSLLEVAGDAGILIDPEETEKISEAMEALMKDGNLRRELRERGIKRAQRYRWEESARILAGVYKKLINDEENGGRCK